MAKLCVLSAYAADPVCRAFQAALASCADSWDTEGLSSLDRVRASQVVSDGSWDALFLDGQFADLTRSVATVQAASMQLAGGADTVFKRNAAVVAINLFGAGATSFFEHKGYSFGGSHVVVCGQGPRALSLVHALAVAGAGRIVLVDETPRKSEEAMRLYLARYKNLAYATIDFSPTEDMHRSFQEAYEQPRYQFGSLSTSTEAIRHADYVFATGEEPYLSSCAVADGVFGEQVLVCHVGASLAESTFANTAQQAGCSVLDGRGALAFSVAQAAVVLAQLHDNRSGSDLADMPNDIEDTLLSYSLEDMFRAASDAWGLPC